MGLFALGGNEERRLPATLLIGALRDVPASENAVRVTLHRMVRRQLLTSLREGHGAGFALTPGGRALLMQGHDRIFSADPFGRAGEGWTLINMATAALSDAERYQLSVRMDWAGFGAVEPRLWLAPGHVDADALLRGAVPEATLEGATVLHGAIAPPTRMERLIARVWDVDAIMKDHLAFLGRWEDRSPQKPALAELLRLLHGWTRLLMRDPGLPVDTLATPWPAVRSTAAFHRLFDTLRQPARDEFDALAGALSQGHRRL